MGQIGQRPAVARVFGDDNVDALGGNGKKFGILHLLRSGPEQ